MGMAIPDHPRYQHFVVTFPIAPSYDAEITCFVCGRANITHEFVARTRGTRATFGVHHECISDIIQSSCTQKAP